MNFNITDLLYEKFRNIKNRFLISGAPTASLDKPKVQKNKDLDKLKKATKDVNDLVKDIEEEDEEDDK